MSAAGIQNGLTTEEAAARLRSVGPNAVVEPAQNRALLFLRKLSGPVPWMLEGALVLELVLAKWIDAAIIGVLLLLNATLSFRQEGRAHAALDALRSKLEVTARALRDGAWTTIGAHFVVPGDVLRIRMGDIVPADLHVYEGAVLVDQSVLTGEAAPVDLHAGGTAFSGSVVKRGEATGTVIATGARSYFGKTAELVRTARAESHLESLMFTIVRYLVALDGALVAAVLVYTFVAHISLHEVVPFALILLVASVPIALPATFTLTTALASLDLAKTGVLVTRLSAIDDAAAMNVLCSDKTGTLTENRLTLSEVRAFPPHSDDEVVSLAAYACDAATQDPIDLAILERTGTATLARKQFIPFDPATKRSEAIVQDGDRELRVVKGAPATIVSMSQSPEGIEADVEALAALGSRVIAVAAGPPDALRLVGLLALADPPRADSKEVVARLRELGIRVIMVTGDSAATAAFIAKEIGLGGSIAVRGEIESRAPDADVFAGVFPEDKFALVRNLQRAGFVVGMTGDGVNDAPALEQAEVGVAVASATDVAKSAASVILVHPGLADALAVVETGRRVFQRMLTWTLNKLVKTFVISFLLVGGLFATGIFVTTPRHILLLVFTNDFVTMSLASDRVSASKTPDHWDVRALVVSGAALAAAWLVFAFAVLFVGRDVLHLALPQLQTLVFLVLVSTGQATIYLIRERGPFYRSRPGTPMIVASVADLAVVSAIAIGGVLVAPLPARIVLVLQLFVALFAVALDQVKGGLFRRLGLGLKGP